MPQAELRAVAAAVGGCRACPRLVGWREQVGRVKRAAYRGEDYWARGVPGIGDPAARMLVLGLAPGAHGANRTGLPFHGDGAGTFLFDALQRAGFRRGGRLVDCWITNAVKCVPPGNAPTAAERDRCAPYLSSEAAALPLRVVLALGATGWDAALRVLGRPSPKPAFSHGAAVDLGPLTVLASYHPSRQNTNTGRLTPPMLDAVLQQAGGLLAQR